MTEFHYRIDDVRELVLTGEPLRWYVHDAGCNPRRWDVPTERERAMFAEIQRLQRMATAETERCMALEAIIEMDAAEKARIG